MLTNTADIELFLDRHYEDIYWVSERFLSAKRHKDAGQPERARNNLNSFSWSQFEWLCAQILRVQGWKLECFDDNVSWGQAANNSKADIIATRENPETKQNERIFVSCKHWANTISNAEVRQIHAAKESHQHRLFDDFENFAYLMTTSTFVESCYEFANNHPNIELFDFNELQGLNSEYLINTNPTIVNFNQERLTKHKWQPKFGKFAKIQEEHGDFLIRNKDLMKTNQTLRQQIEQEKASKIILENKRMELENKRIDLENKIDQAQNKAQILHNNWQTETGLRQNIEREIQDLNQKIETNQDQKTQIIKKIDDLTTKISQQEKELNREKTQNQIGTRINFGLLKEKYSLSQNIKQIQQKTSQILWQKDLEKSKLTQKYQHNSHSLEQNLQEESLGKIILSTSLIIVFGLFLTMSFWIILS